MLLTTDYIQDMGSHYKSQILHYKYSHVQYISHHNHSTPSSQEPWSQAQEMNLGMT